MSSFNLSAWALRHRNFVLYLMVLTLGLGIFGYTKLGQSEDPPFTFKVMLVQAYWSGATAQEIESQVTERIEKVILETAHVDIVRSFSRPGETNIFVIAKDDAPSAAMPDMFYDIRKRVGDMRHTLPQGVVGPLFNDEFGETYGNIFALTGDGFNFAQLRDAADDIRKELLLVKDVAKILSIGEQEERVTITLANSKLANLGFSVQQLVDVLQAQNAIAAVGAYNTATDRIYVRPAGTFSDLEDIRNLPITIGNRTLRLHEVAEVTRGYADPPHSTFRYQGQEALGIGISMRKGGDIIALGKSLDAALVRIESQLPVGMELHRVNDQPTAVKRSINEFLKVVAEAVIIVLAVSFLSLGMRAGAVVALSIPLVLAATFFVMYLFGIGLHKISLGSLVLALGLLVDDAIIAIEVMLVKMEEGWDRVRAASFAYTTTAFPMLTGTLITAAGFLPIATAQSSVGEFTRSIFQVITIALVISWLVAVIVIPYLGYKLLKVHPAKETPPSLPLSGEEQNSAATLTPSHDKGRVGEGFLRWFRGLIKACVAYPLIVIVLTVATFAGSIFMFQFVQQQFFPDSTRMELVVDLKLPEGSSLQATEAETRKLEQYLDTQQEHIENFAAYVGNGAPRFYLPLDQQLPSPVLRNL
ncbi:efflux RND transporter permease subunit [Thiothrix subterranea]|uniref:efflux RND transporter permease subunit n=1 Tax=Thiothrix subterranea TaxID=2735563 RepID=UPI00280A625C|nr:efflux RND transporter permease subunit [Thiothrix subterranea]